MAAPNKHKIFLVHGRQLQAVSELSTFLGAAGIEIVTWEEAVSATQKAAPYIGEVLKAGFRLAQAIIILLTGDDLARLRSEYLKPNDQEFERRLTPQARPNVIFEAGLALGMSPKRTIFVSLGNSRPFSDIAGRHLVALNDSETARHTLLQRLKVAGCELNDSGNWKAMGSFRDVIWHANRSTQFEGVFGTSQKLHIVLGGLFMNPDIRLSISRDGNLDKEARDKLMDHPLSKSRSKFSFSANDVVGSCELRSAEYMYRAIADSPNVETVITTDEQVQHSDIDLIAFGAYSNNKTRYLTRDGQYDLVVPAIFGKRDRRFISKTSRRPVTPELEPSEDFGMIARIRPSGSPEFTWIACAGLGEWGTSGAAWYLMKHWRELATEVGPEQNFVVLLKAQEGDDSLTTRIGLYTSPDQLTSRELAPPSTDLRALDTVS